MPAFYCGLFGINPTAGYTSLKGTFSIILTGCRNQSVDQQLYRPQVTIVTRSLSSVTDVVLPVAGSALRSGKDDTMASIGFVSRHSCDLAALTKVILADKAAELDLDRPVDLKVLI